MTLDEIKAAVDAGRSVYWHNEGYRVHKDRLGQFLITFNPNGHTIGLTNQDGTILNGNGHDFFIVTDGVVSIHCQECGSEDVLRDCWATWNPELQVWETADLQDHAYCQTCDGETKLVERKIRDYGSAERGEPAHEATCNI